jgi:hypothetical protein
MGQSVLEQRSLVSDSLAVSTLDQGQGKSMYMFSAQRQQISTFRLLALTTEAWRGAEIRRHLAENEYVEHGAAPYRLLIELCKECFFLLKVTEIFYLFYHRNKNKLSVTFRMEKYTFCSSNLSL